MTVGSKVRYALRNSFVPVIGWERWNKLQHRALHGYWPDFRNPSTFLEYLQHCKYYGLTREMGPLVDKYLVKEYVRNTIGDDHVIPTKAIVRLNEPVPYDILPDRWIAKSVHAAAWNYLHFGGSIDRFSFERKISRWLSKNYFDIGGEVNYRYISPKIMFEPLISELDQDLVDYKIWCFDGAARFVGVHGDRQNTPKGQIFNLDWTSTNWIYPDIGDWSIGVIPKPFDLDQMISVAEKLAAPFPFVRVDLYEVCQKIYFGELTFTPGDGNNIRIPLYEDQLLGASVVNHTRDPSFKMTIDVPAGSMVQEWK